MSTQGLEKAGRTLLASPTAVFVAVLSVGMATASFARHAGLYQPNGGVERQANVVLACPRTKPAHATKSDTKCPVSASQPQQKASTAGTSHSSGASATRTSAAAPATETASASSEKQTAGKTGGGLSLPDFSTPELSRFISPL
jgi:hypothetical protein